jgi:hypothetical protein
MAEVAGEVKLVLSADGTSWSAAIDQAQRNLNKLKGSTAEVGKVTRAEMTEARHAIHLVGSEIGIELPRAIQGFVAKLPGVAEVMASAFSAAAIVGIGMALFEAGKKVVEFIEKTKKASEEARRATERLIESRHLATLELEASTAKIEEQIAKLEKKPGDGLKLGLAEARVEAEKLAHSLRSDVEELQKLVETKLSANWFMGAVTGAAGNQGTLDQIDKYGEKLAEIAHITDPAKRTEEMKEFTGGRLVALHEEIAARERLQELLTKSKAAPLGEADLGEFQKLSDRFKTGVLNGNDQTKALTALKAFHDSVQEQYDFAAATEEHMTAQQELGRDQAEKDRADAAKEALEALKRQTAERMAVIEQDLAEEKTMHAMTLEEERTFLLKRYMAGTNLADPINDLIQRRIAPLSQQIFKKQASDAKEWLIMMTELQRESDRAAGQNNPFAPDREQSRNLGETESARMAALHDRPELLRQIAAAQEELNASEAVATGRMEKSTEEILKQTNVLARLRYELGELEGKRAAVAALPRELYTPGMNPEVLQNDIIRKRAEIQAAEQTLQYQTERDTFGSEMRQLFMDWTRRATDLRGTMASIFDQSISTVNNAIVKTLVDPYHRGDWKAAGKSIFAGIAGTGLSAAEGSILKAFGFGSNKLGTQQNPMWIRYAGTPVGAAGGQVINSLLGSTSTTAASSVGSGVGKVLGALISSIPFMAEGGPLDTGMPAIVGERGPELFVPSGSGKIVPNNALGGMTHVWNIDARGSSDPAAVRFAVQRGILEAAPRIAAGSIAASRDLAARKPIMAR